MNAYHRHMSRFLAASVVALLCALTGAPVGYAAAPSPLECAALPDVVPLVVKATPGRIMASWSREGVTSGQLRWHQTGTRVWQASAQHPTGHASWSAPGGHDYEVQLRVSCYDLTGQWGAATPIQVPRIERPPGAPTRVAVSKAGVQWTASDGAASYVVKYRKAHRHHWITRRVRGLSIHARHVARAKLRAVNPSGSSNWRVARRLASGF